MVENYGITHSTEAATDSAQSFSLATGLLTWLALSDRYKAGSTVALDS